MSAATPAAHGVAAEVPPNLNRALPEFWPGVPAISRVVMSFQPSLLGATQKRPGSAEFGQVLGSDHSTPWLAATYPARFRALRSGPEAMRTKYCPGADGTGRSR